jgi:hypothetical protein
VRHIRKFDAEAFEAEERLVLDVTEMLFDAMARREITQADWAVKLGVTEGELSQRLSGKRNLTLRSVAHMLHRIGYGVQVGLVDRINHNKTYFARHYESEFKQEVGERQPEPARFPLESVSASATNVPTEHQPWSFRFSVVQ